MANRTITPRTRPPYQPHASTHALLATQALARQPERYTLTSWRHRRARSVPGRLFFARGRPIEAQRSNARRRSSWRNWSSRFPQTTVLAQLLSSRHIEWQCPVGRSPRRRRGARCGRRARARASEGANPARHMAGPRHKGRSQLSGWSCRGVTGPSFKPVLPRRISSARRTPGRSRAWP